MFLRLGTLDGSYYYNHPYYLTSILYGNQFSIGFMEVFRIWNNSKELLSAKTSKMCSTHMALILNIYNFFIVFTTKLCRKIANPTIY
jgi:hypothetical protein